MPVEVICSCGNRLKVETRYAQRRVKCPKCGASERMIPPPAPPLPPTAGERFRDGVLLSPVTYVIFIGAAVAAGVVVWVLRNTH